MLQFSSVPKPCVFSSQDLTAVRVMWFMITTERKDEDG